MHNYTPLIFSDRNRSFQSRKLLKKRKRHVYLLHPNLHHSAPRSKQFTILRSVFIARSRGLGYTGIQDGYKYHSKRAPMFLVVCPIFTRGSRNRNIYKYFQRKCGYTSSEPDSVSEKPFDLIFTIHTSLKCPIVLFG